jgi:four helix bundle protein
MAYIKYEDLEVYKLAYQLAKDAHIRSFKFPQHEQFNGLADQLRRATKSICGNISEGLGKEASALEERRFLSIALGSASEVRTWLCFVKDFNYDDQERIENWQVGYLRVSKMLRALIQRRR